MGVAAPRRLRRLDITPASDVLTALSAQTGIDVAFMRTRMTFYGLDRELVPRVLAAVPHCPACVAGCDGTGRKVERLSTIAPWVFACDRHATAINTDELDTALDGAAMPRDLARFSACLDSAACREVSRPFAAIERSTAECLRLVDAINEQLRLRVRAGPDGAPAFDIADLREAPDGVIAPKQRNSRAVSAWYAWHVTSSLDRALQRPAHQRDRAQLRGLVMLLFNLATARPSAVAVRNPAARNKAVGAAVPDIDDPARLILPPPWLVGSPFAAADLRWRLLPSLPPLLSDLVRVLLGPALETPSRAGLAPYRDLVEAARAMLATRGGSLRPRDLTRLAVRLLRRRGRRPEQALGDIVAPDLGVADVAAGDVGRAVAGLLHDGGEVGAGERRRGGEAGAQAVAGEILGRQSEQGGGVLDGAGDGLVGQPHRGDLAALADAGEQRPGGLAADRAPGLEGTHRAEFGMAAAVDGQQRAAAALVGLRAPQRDHQTLRHHLDVGEIERHQFAAPQGAAEANQQQGLVARAGGSAAVEGGQEARQHFEQQRHCLAGRCGALLAPKARRMPGGDQTLAGVELDAGDPVGGDDGGQARAPVAIRLVRERSARKKETRSGWPASGAVPCAAQ